VDQKNGRTDSNGGNGDGPEREIKKRSQNNINFKKKLSDLFF
jgi:hypothetical protein